MEVAAQLNPAAESAELIERSRALCEESERTNAKIEADIAQRKAQTDAIAEQAQEVLRDSQWRRADTEATLARGRAAIESGKESLFKCEQIDMAELRVRIKELEQWTAQQRRAKETKLRLCYWLEWGLEEIAKHGVPSFTKEDDGDGATIVVGPSSSANTLVYGVNGHEIDCEDVAAVAELCDIGVTAKEWYRLAARLGLYSFLTNWVGCYMPVEATYDEAADALDFMADVLDEDEDRQALFKLAKTLGPRRAGRAVARQAALKAQEENRTLREATRARMEERQSER